jgi:NADH dehydrogenase FAD-containing subunit
VRLRVGRVERLVDHALAFAKGPPLSYDTLLYAAGSTIDITSVPGVAEHAHTVTSPESALAIAAALRADTRARVVVCGGGLTGLELAAEVAESFPHADITLVTAGAPGGWLSARAQAYVATALDELGVRRIADTRVTRVAADHLETAAGRGPEFDLCLWAGGFTVPRLATDAGMKVDGRGRVVFGPLDVEIVLSDLSLPTGTKLLPDADIFTLFYDPESISPAIRAHRGVRSG